MHLDKRHLLQRVWLFAQLDVADLDLIVPLTREQPCPAGWTLFSQGDTSGDRQFIRAAYYDCDGDTLLFVVEQEGKGACHTGEHTCFYRAFGSVDAGDPAH